MSSNKSETAVCGSLFEDLDDWEVITGYHQNRTLVSQPIETLAYFQLVWRKSSGMILSGFTLFVPSFSTYFDSQLEIKAGSVDNSRSSRQD